MNQNSTCRVTTMEKATQRPFISLRNERNEAPGRKCAFPSCEDCVWKDSYCEWHYTHEYYTCK